MFSTPQIIALANSYCEERGVAPATLCQKAVGNSKFLARLEDGRVTLRSLARLIQYLSDHWPPDLAWPADVPRPGSEAPGAASPLLSDPEFPAAVLRIIPVNGETDACLALRARDAGIDAGCAEVRWALDALAHLGLVRVDRREPDWYAVRPREAA